MENLSLGILIPTWDRPDRVSARLAEIALQFGCDQRVHVQVNPGDYDSYKPGYSPLQSAITVNQNQANVGFVANILVGIINLDD
jgi:GT2 family glycosyltransferase